jgi:menaquinone-dependent protoporphyrinogen oxidase
MSSILVAYGTGEGQTAKVAERVGSVLSDRGHDVTTVDVADAAGVDVADFDAVLVGSPVNNRRHRPDVYAFVERNREALTSRPAGFFQLSLASVVPWRWAREGAGEFADEFVERTGWQPDRVGLFAGAVRYTQYDRRTRWLFRLVSAVTTGDTDTSRDYEYTDWDAVERFAAEFADLVEAEHERTPPPVERTRRVVAGLARRPAVVLGVVGLGLGLAGAIYWGSRRGGEGSRDAVAVGRRRAGGQEADDPATAPEEVAR